MPKSVTSTPASFVGRTEYIARYRARLEHYRFSVFVGLPGIGKTSLILQLAKEASAAGMENVVYLPLSPGEGIPAVVARLEARLSGRIAAPAETQADALRRVVDVLRKHRALVMLDDMQNLRSEEFPGLVRTVNACPGDYRILGASRVEPEVSAMDRAALHIELLRPLSPPSAVALAQSFGMGKEGLEIVHEDALRGGSTGHPLALTYLASLFGDSIPSKDFLEHLSSRSMNSFKTIWAEARGQLTDEERAGLSLLARVGAPLERKVAVKAFGSVVDQLVERRLVDEIEGLVYVHNIVSHIVDSETVTIPQKSARVLAKALQGRALKSGEPMGIIRAGELLAHAGMADQALDALSQGWESVRDFGFLQAYLKSLASIPADETMAARLKVLGARARMRQGDPALLTDEMEALAAIDDPWTQTRALGALTYIYSQRGDHASVVAAYERLEKVTQDSEALLQSGTLAAVSMARIQRVTEAEQLARNLLSLLKGKKRYDHEGQMYRLIARICAQAGRLQDAVKKASAAAGAFELAGDLYHCATAWGYIGDLYREAGDFEKAKQSYEKFREAALKWGDRNLIQIAELADAWVSLDIGDLTHAAKLIAAVEKDIGGVPSRRLKRYLAAAQVMLQSGRGEHAEALVELERQVATWARAGQGAIADIIRAQLVRSLVATGKLEKAEKICAAALSRLDAKSAAPRVAIFLRESALVHLRKKDYTKAMRELTRARKLFAAGGNRREEVLTLHRIANAALDEGKIKQASAKADEAMKLARKLRHQRAIALSRELESRIALATGNVDEAVISGKEALQSLRKLGDDLGTLHVSELLLRAYIAAADLSSAIRLGPRVGSHAERVGIREVRIRAIVLTGVALLRKGRPDAARRCFREIPVGALSPMTGAFMWRLGEGLATGLNGGNDVSRCRSNWVAEIKRMPESRQLMALEALTQLGLPPRKRCQQISADGRTFVGNELMGWTDYEQYPVVLDLASEVVFEKDAKFNLKDDVAVRLLSGLIMRSPRVLRVDEAYELILGGDEPEELTAKKLERLVKSHVKDLGKQLKGSELVKIDSTKTGFKLKMPKNGVSFVPVALAEEDLTQNQRNILTYLAQCSVTSLQKLQDALEMPRSVARRELTTLIEEGHVESLREGRGQSFRLT